MKSPLHSVRSFVICAAALCGGLLSRADIPVPDEPGIVGYNPVVKIAQGNQPYSETYQLQITMPSTLTPGVTIPLGLQIDPLSLPDGVSVPTARSFISLSTSAVSINQPNQIVLVGISIAVPAGSVAGAYSWKLTTTGWPQDAGEILDNGHTINGIFSAPAEPDDSTPAIVLTSPVNGTVYTYYPATGNPVNVPVNFTASVAETGQPIRGLSAFINGSPLNFVASGMNTHAASGTGSVQLTAPGVYTISANATNLHGTSTASSDISVQVSAPPPSISVASPLAGASIPMVLGGSGVSVSISASATSQYGNITAFGATLNGNTITLGTTGVGTAATAQGSATLPITAPGSYSLVFTASNDYGNATPVTVPFTVTSVAPTPTVSILTPANGANFNRTQGDPATVVNYSFTGGTSFGAITAVTAKLNGQTITPSLTGLNTVKVTGSGSLKFSAGGAQTLTVTVSNGSATATATTNFTITEAPAPLCRDLTWLPPISLNKTVEGGSTVPIKFTLSCKGKQIEDKKVYIAIYKVYANGSTSNPTIYPYGTGSPNPPDYAITGKQYHLNFETERGSYQYKVEVYTTANGSAQFIDSTDIYTKKKGRDDDNCRDWKHDHKCRDHKHDHDRQCRNRDHDHDGRDCKRDRNDDCDTDHDCRNRDHDHSGRDRNRGRDRDCDRDRGRW